MIKIAVASGEGSIGKTMIATSLALVVAADLRPLYPKTLPPLFLDCNIESPKAHLFLKPTFDEGQDVVIHIPQLDESRCSRCGECVSTCGDHAIANFGNQVLFLPQSCSGCGCCTRICPEKAISGKPVAIGVLERGTAALGIPFAHGVLYEGKPVSERVIRQLKKWITPQNWQVVIIDTPPAPSHLVVESAADADFLLLVSEPTPFDLSGLKSTVQMGHDLHLPMGVIVHYDRANDFSVDKFCDSERIPILMRIPFERTMAEETAHGKTLIEIHPECVVQFTRLLERIVECWRWERVKEQLCGRLTPEQV